MPTPATPDFASDNAAGVLPEVMQALVDANRGCALAYGRDPWTARAIADVRAALGAPGAEVAFTFGGTGANVVALGAVLGPHEAVVCAETAHLHVDECGAPERIAGGKLLVVSTADGKLTVEDVRPWLAWRGDVHRVQPRIVSVSQATELGTVYRPDELRELADFAHRHGLLVHVDGARIANAAASLGVGLAAITSEVGVDLLSFGGTKAGMAFGEAVVVLDPANAGRLAFARKQAGQLASKMRFIAAQWSALLADDLLLRSAAHANAMASRLATAVAAIPGVEVVHPCQANAVFATLSPATLSALGGPTAPWVWDAERSLVRWMTSWQTRAEDVDALVAWVGAAARTARP